MTRLTIENVSKLYPGGVAALKDFSLEIEEGELVAIVGPSGCGKSTLLRIIAGLEEETSGKVRMGERFLTGLPPKERNIAVVFQSYTLMPHLTAAENMAFGMRLRGTFRNQREEKIRAIAKTLGIEGLLNRYPAEISGGERQRVALGRAILREPDAFLFDEPLSGLDAQMRLQLRVEIQKLHQRLGTPMLFVTHDQNEALALGDRVVVLNQGKIQQIAKPDELYLKPANTFVASFIGAPGMNLFPGRLESNGNVHRFVSSSVTFPLTPSQASTLRTYSEVVAGIRPEHLNLSHPPDAELRGTVTAIEKQFDQTCLYLENENVVFTAKAARNISCHLGDVLQWSVALDNTAFFDAITGELIL